MILVVGLPRNFASACLVASAATVQFGGILLPQRLAVDCASAVTATCAARFSGCVGPRHHPGAMSGGGGGGGGGDDVGGSFNMSLSLGSEVPSFRIFNSCFVKDDIAIHSKGVEMRDRKKSFTVAPDELTVRACALACAPGARCLPPPVVV